MTQEQPPGAAQPRDRPEDGADRTEHRTERRTTGHARAFGAVARAYDRGRPAYPREAAAWLVGGEARTVLELGAGTGKLTAELVALGHDVHATDPDDAMLEVLRERVPDAKAQRAGAEELPVHDRSVDVVVCAQSFHWFDHERALPEIARVLKPGGHLAMVWNRPDRRIPWVRRFSALVGEQDQRDDLADPVVHSALFGFVEEHAFSSWQHLDRESIVDLTLSRSHIATLDDEAREEKLAEVIAFYDDYGRGMDGMQLPYTVSCYRSVAVDRPRAGVADGEGAASSDGAEGPDGADGPDRPRGDGDAETPTGRTPDPGVIVSDGTDTDMLLIDFR
jgi:ubiquinone/menaquinone biosynthesis C-methylase UbiE